MTRYARVLRSGRRAEDMNMKLHGWVAVLFAMAPMHSIGQAIDIPKLIAQDVQCRGNQRTSCDFIRSHVHIDAGDVLNECHTAKAEQRLPSLLNFEAVSVPREKRTQRHTAIVVIEVTEADAVASEFLLGTSARLDSLRGVFAGRVAHQNVFGAGKILDATV